MSNWIQLDPGRENWLFVILGVKSNDSTSELPANASRDEPISYWEIGVGNSESLLRTIAEQRGAAGITSEAEVLEALCEELNPYRHEETVIITPTRETVRHLRRRLLRSKSDDMSLRGFRHIAVDETLQKYFGQSISRYNPEDTIKIPPRTTETDPIETVSSGAVQSFMNLWVQLYRLVPADELTGTQL